MSDFLLFLGRFHVLVLHLPIGMVLLTFIVHWLGRNQFQNRNHQILPLLWGCTAFSAIVTVVLGLLHFTEGGFTGPSATAHRLWGIGFAGGTIVVWFLSVFSINVYRQWGTSMSLLLLAAVTVTGHYGGNLTHGSTYLMEFAPQPVRDVAGMEPARERVTSTGSADPWHDVVKPILDQRCSNCHNADKQRGELDLSSLDALMVGGESGAIVLAGNARGSDLYKRITLPENHDNFMPAEGKTPLTEEQVQILEWWIDAGLPSDTTVSSVQVDPEVTALIAVELGLAAPEMSTRETADSYSFVSKEALEQMTDSGWQVRPLMQDSNGLVVSVLSIGQPVTLAMIEALGPAAGSIVDLNMASSGLDDDMLSLLGDMPVLKYLNLSNNSITDSGLASLGDVSSLKMLNLYGNQGITDEGMQHLQQLSNLETLYLWGTSVSNEGMTGVMTILPELSVTGQFATTMQSGE